MGLNIKNEEAHKLAQEIATLTGESLTAAVTAALRERLERLRQEQPGSSRLDHLMAIASRCAAALNAPGGPKMLKMDDLYDEETGLPK